MRGRSTAAGLRCKRDSGAMNPIPRAWKCLRPYNGHNPPPPPRCISYANVNNYYGPYAYCSLDKGVACAQHIQLPAHTCEGHMR